MRPLKLRLSGLRSWREEQVLSFHDIDLAAVVGPTGAGKSSILEAIVYALYNATTYEGNVKSLISSDVGTVSVAFDFEADGERWRATRSTSASGYPPPVHRLACTSNAEAHPPVEGRTAVTDAVTALLGLSVDQFTSAVVLPQGRFQRLLTATEGERVAILRGVFRLDELDATRERALELRRQLDPELDEALDARAKLLPDPAVELADARVAFDAARAEVEALAVIAVRHAEELRRAEAAAALASAARASATALRAAVSAVPSLADVVTAEAALAAREAAIDRPVAVAARDAARAAVAAADADGRTIRALTTAEHTLVNAETALPRLDQRRAELASQRATLSADIAALATDRDAHDATDLTPLTGARDRLTGEARAADAALDSARDRLGEARRAARAERDADAAVTAAGTALAAATATATDAERAAELAGARLEAAEQVFEQAVLDHQAAHVAAGLNPGDECPVCHSTIPAGFTPDEPPAALAGARTAVDRERTARDAATRAATAATTTASTREAELSRARSTHTSSMPAAVAALATAHAAGALPLDDTSAPRHASAALAAVASSGVLARGDADLLAPLLSAATSAEQAARAAADALATATAGHEGTARELVRRARELAAREAPLAAAEQALATEREAIRAALDALPYDDLAVVRAALVEVQELHAAQKLADAQLEAIDAELTAIGDERSAQVDRPRQAALRRGDALAVLLGAPERPDGDLRHDVDWLVGLTAQATTAADGHDADATTRDGEASTAAGAARAALGDFADAGALDEALTDQRAAQRSAQRRIDRAEHDVPLVAALEERIVALRARREALDELARLLNPGQFVGWLVQRRQQHLLAVSSEILAGMTGDRYRFTADFTVYDGRTGQPRSPRTLSGGESFLASLALALGMAEIAARSGGRIGSLYLDEGFGSLDPNALDEAIEALEARARAGQMIMVISHVPTVAQRIERVLRVTPSPGGSSAAWLDDADREALLTPVPAE